MAGSGGGSLDSGVGARVLGSILTWMSEKTSPVFVYATANDVTSLPPELLRKGRFDEMWSVMMPNKVERKEIFDIHIRKRGRGNLIDSRVLDLDQLIIDTAGFSGAEIEALIVESLYSAFDVGKDLNMLDLKDSIKNTNPVSRQMVEKLKKLEEWCQNRTRPANEQEDDWSEVGHSRRLDN